MIFLQRLFWETWKFCLLFQNGVLVVHTSETILLIIMLLLLTNCSFLCKLYIVPLTKPIFIIISPFFLVFQEDMGIIIKSSIQRHPWSSPVGKLSFPLFMFPFCYNNICMSLAFLLFVFVALLIWIFETLQGSDTMTDTTNLLEPAFFSNEPVYHLQPQCSANSTTSVSIQISSIPVSQGIIHINKISNFITVINISGDRICLTSHHMDTGQI